MKTYSTIEVADVNEIESLAKELFEIAMKHVEGVVKWPVKWSLVSEPTRITYREMATHVLTRAMEDVEDVDVPKELADIEGALDHALDAVHELIDGMKVAAKQAAAS